MQDSAIRDQKVFVRLDKVMELQRLTQTAINQTISLEKKPSSPERDAQLQAARSYQRGLELAVTTLSLPVQLSK